MGIFKSAKTRNIFIYTICGIIIVAASATACIVICMAGEPQPTNTANHDSEPNNKIDDSSTQTNDSESDGHLYTIVPCEEVAAITGDDCGSNTTAPTYNPYTYTYTPSETTPNTTPTTPQYNVPEYTPTPTPTPTCADYHAQYYAEYQRQLSSTNSHYNSAISDASMSCAGNGGGFGGCPQATNLERQWQAAVSQLNNSYKTNMSDAGCDPSEYVNF